METGRSRVTRLWTGRWHRGTSHEPGETPPSDDGAPTADAPCTRVCDAFYRVGSGGRVPETDRGTIRVAFERPTVWGFERRERAIAAANSRIGGRFSRVGVENEPGFYVDTPADAGHAPAAPEGTKAD